MRLTRCFQILALLFSLSALNACGGAQQLNAEQQAQLDAFYAKVALILSHKNQSPASQDAPAPNGSGSVEEPGPTRQTLVTGAIRSPNFSGGSISIEVYEAEPCAEGYCPAEHKAPLAALQIPSTGYFSILVPSRGQKTSLLANGGGKRGVHYLGELNGRLDNIQVKLQ